MAKLSPPGPLDFSNTQEHWNGWLKRFQRYRQASGLDEKSAQRQVDTLIYIMGEEAEKVYAQLEITAPTEAQAEDNPNVLYERTVTAFTDYFQPTSNTLHYSILLSNFEQKDHQSNEQFIRELYELVSKCGFTAEQQQTMIKMRLLAGMRDKTLSRELQLDAQVTVETIKLKMRAKETILKNQRVEMDGEKSVAAVRSNMRSTRTTQKTLGRGAFKGENESGGVGVTTYQTGAEADFVRDCKFCGGSHARRRCPAYGKRCNNCKQFNHFSRMCKSKIKAHALDVNTSQGANVDSEFSQSDEFLYLDSLSVSSVTDTEIFECGSKWLIDVKMGAQGFTAKVDTGAEVSVLSRSTAKGLGITRVRKCKATVTAYTGNPIPIIGKVDLEISVVCAGSLRHCVETFYVVDQNSNTLLGMPAIKALSLIPAIAQVSSDSSSPANDEIMTKYSHVFEGLGKYHTPISLQLKEGAVPKATPARQVPEKVRTKLKAELDRLVQEGIIERDTEPSEWLSPPIIVNKPDGSIRLCLDPQYLNTQLVRTQCCLSTPTEIFSRISGSKYFSCLDGKQGFHQLELDEQSSRLTCFLTPFGKYRYLRLPMGITNAPELFHQTMLDLVQGIQGVECYIDDLIIHAKTINEHNDRLTAVLDRFSKAGLTLNKAKSVIGQTEVTFLGHELSEHGIRPHTDKVNAIKEMVEPQDKQAVQSFLGFVGYLSKFIQDLSEIAMPLRQVCKKNVQFTWQQPQREAFDKIKQVVANAPTLAYYDPEADVVVTADSSAHSLGAALLQGDRPVEFAAKSLSESQQRYSQIEKELLAITFACRRFKYYLWGRATVTVETDHRPLLGLFTKPISALSPRLAQMRLELLTYPVTLELRFKPGKDMVLADVLSRTCAPGTDVCDDLGADPLLQVCQLLIRSEEAMTRFQKATENDEELPVVLKYVREGWPGAKKSCANRALPYYHLNSALSEVNGVVMYGSRVVVPTALRSDILDRLHAAHQGVTKTLQRAQNSVFWPGLRKRVEERCQACEECLRAEGETRKEPLIPFPIPQYPFQTVGVDLFVISGENYAMIIDYLTKWPVVKPLRQSTSSRAVIKVLQGVFSDYGVPEKLISDNASQFTCSEFGEFCSDNQIKHSTSSPLHSSGNGQVERTIGTVKAMIKKCVHQGRSWEEGLLAIRNTPVGSGLLAPSQYLQGRLLREKTIPVPTAKLVVQGYDLSEYRDRLGEIKSRDKFYHDAHSGKEKCGLEKGQPCYFKTAKGIWARGTVDKLVGDRSYIVNRPDGTEFRRNRKDIKVSGNSEPGDAELHPSVNFPATFGRGNSTGEAQVGNETGNETAVVTPEIAREAVASESPPQSTREPRPRRETRLPSRYRDSIVYFK